VIRPHDPQTLYPAVPCDYAVVATAGHTVFTAGACPLDSNGDVVAPGDFEAQARQALDLSSRFWKKRDQRSSRS
jgi:enamine deaminase RidA (YjgF/YER057c/UK114 family)